MKIEAYKRRSSDKVPNWELIVPFKEALGRFLHIQIQQKSVSAFKFCIRDSEDKTDDELPDKA